MSGRQGSPSVLAPLPERCCPVGQCAYSVRAVRNILAVIRDAPRWGDDPGEAASAALAGKGEGRTGVSAGSDNVRHATLVWDVQQAIRAIGGRPSAEAISERLCPFGATDDTES